MAITASMVKELREITGAGMMDCKKALTATNGDKEKAIDWLREKVFPKLKRKLTESLQKVLLLPISVKMEKSVCLSKLTAKQTLLLATNNSVRWLKNCKTHRCV